MLVVYNDAMIMREDYSAEAFMCVNLLVNKKVHDVMYVCNIYYCYWGRVRKVMHSYVGSMPSNIVLIHWIYPLRTSYNKIWLLWYL